MDPLTLSLLGAGAALVARLFGEALAAGDLDKAAKLKEQAIAEYGDDILPELEKVEGQTIKESALGNLKNAPEGRSAQLDALARLGEFAGPGLAPEDAADLRRVTDAAGGVAARAAGAGEQLAAARGLSKSGLSQALAMQGAQAAAQTSSDTAAQMMSDARRRKLQALGMMQSGAGQLRGQDWGEASDSASAIDALNKFNANMLFDAQQARNKNALSMYDAQIGLKDKRNAARGSLADFYAGRAARNSKTARDMGAGVQGGFQGGADYLQHESDMDRMYPKKGGK